MDTVSGPEQDEPEPAMLDDSRLRALGLAPGQNRDGTGDPVAEFRVGGHQSGLHDDPPVVADTPMWLSHHWPGDYDRCVSVAGLHICRRCLVLYPVALVAGIVINVGSWWDETWDPLVLWLFPLPGVIEFVLDNVRVVAYRPRRQVALSALGAVAAGVGYVRYLDDLTDPLVWSVVAVYTSVCLSAAMIGGLWRRRSTAEAGKAHS